MREIGMKEQKRASKKVNPFVWVLLALLIVASGAYGYSFWQKQQQNAAAGQAAPTYQTTTIRRGDLSNTISGSGSIVSSNTIDLGFATNGAIGQLNVQVGDSVKKGQVLAVLDGFEQLKLDVSNKAFAIESAQKALDDLKTGADKNLAQAFADQAAAQSAYEQAVKNVHKKGDPRCDKNTTETYYYQYLDWQAQVNTWEGHLADPNTGYGRDFILEKLVPLRKSRDIAQANYTYCQGYTDQEIQTSQANLQVAAENMHLAQANYTLLKLNNGIDPNTLKIDQAMLDNAQLQLTQAQNNLQGATITAPIDGTVTMVNGTVGQKPSKTAVISLADLHHPQVQVNIDETDLTNFAVGCPAEVTFPSLPGQTFPGVVSQVSPQLATTQNVTSAQGLVDLKNNVPADQPLLLGLNASVNVTCQQAKNVIQAPVPAIYEPAGQPAYVYILNILGQPEKRQVTIGLQTSSFAEIRSGLNAGDRVITTPIKGQ